MALLRRLVLLTLVFLFAGTSLMLVPPEKVEAATCGAGQGPVRAFGRQNWCGYFSNQLKTYGDSVRLGGVPGGVNRDELLISFIENQLNNGNTHQRTAAQFLILTMLGRGPGGPKSVTAAQLQDWKERVASYADNSENGLFSFGQNGRIDWYVSEPKPCAWYPNIGWRATNTYYQKSQWEENNGITSYDDVAPYLDADCSVKHDFILFRDISGNVIYRIRRACLNPIGDIGGLKKPAKYDLTPSITARVDGQVVSGGAEIGQTIQFTYNVVNSSSDPSPPTTNCRIYTNVHSGYFIARSNPPPGGGAGPPTGCPRSFPGNSSTPLGGTESIVVVTGNQTICRTLVVSPATATVGFRSDEACVPVVNKPYFRVYGGDVLAGGGQETSPDVCVSNPDAAIISWNRGSGGGYGGAGVQFAALALNRIYEVATSLGNPGSSTPRPKGLAFANTTASGASIYGGSFGSLPCINDFYAARPASTKPFNGLAAANITGSGAYSWNNPGVLSLAGSILPGRRITLYVDNNVFINGNITYPASWNSGNAPLLQLVVRGDIYIRSNVSRIDGVFIAQKRGAAGGTIYTCAIAAAPLLPDGNLYNRCNSKLTINGAFVANQVQLLRTRGTRQQGTAGETAATGRMAEVFNFSPAMWMAQPVGSLSGPTKYDLINGLPPIL